MNARRETGPRLGRGLAALMGDAAVQAPAQGATVRQVPLDHVHLRNLRLSTGSADVLLHRHGKNIAATVTRRDGDVVVVVRY